MKRMLEISAIGEVFSNVRIKFSVIESKEGKLSSGDSFHIKKSIKDCNFSDFHNVKQHSKTFQFSLKFDQNIRKSSCIYRGSKEETRSFDEFL